MQHYKLRAPEPKTPPQTTRPKSTIRLLPKIGRFVQSEVTSDILPCSTHSQIEHIYTQGVSSQAMEVSHKASISATKADDALVPTDLWDKQACLHCSTIP